MKTDSSKGTTIISNLKNSSEVKHDDSTTEVYLAGSKRVLMTIRIRPELKEAIKSFCSAEGLSLCHIFEAMISGFLTAIEKTRKVHHSFTIENLIVTREVKRVRRKKV